MNVDRNRAKSIFLEAVENCPPERWDAYLDGACGGDADLRRRVRVLLDAHQQADSLIDNPGPAATVTVERSLAEGVGAVIGPYKLLEQIGAGGMGIVYMAEQTQPVRRKVALKIIKPGMDTGQVIARFEAERQALAMMDHPNIAKVLDAGATDSGRPYFAMDLVRGIPITEYCDQHRLPIHKRLGLFMQVCQAVQHAHHKGIIHRDIKPTNVLVSSLDGMPLPKVIDFGIAKATGQSLTDKTLFTGHAQLIGTPLYMSPEQAELSAVDIDTRSDVYSLGVLLYELLTGTTPFDRGSFRAAALDEVRRIIREDEPPKPSTRLSALGATLTTVSENRQTDARMLSRSLRGELDWIVMKTLEKDRRRRYDTASGLARDVERYLSGDPVEAGPPSGWYRLRKYARRNRVVLTTTVLVALALIAGTAVSTWQAIVARRARADALTQRDRARKAVDEMYTQVAEKWLSQQPQLELVQREFLLKALAFYQEFARERGSDPAARAACARAELRAGGIHKKLGEYNSAERAYRRALDVHEALVAEFPKDPEYRRALSDSCCSLGLLLRVAGRPAEAEPAIRRAAELGNALLAQFPEELEYRRAVADSQSALGQVLLEIGRLTEAESAHRRAVEHGKTLLAEFPKKAEVRQAVATYYSGLGHLCRAIGREPEAESAYREALELTRASAADSPKDPGIRLRLGVSYTNLDTVLSETDRLGEAEAASRQALKVYESLSADFPRVPDYRNALAVAYFNLGNLTRTMGRLPEAESAYRRSLELRQALSAEFPAVPVYRRYLAESHNNFGNFLERAGRLKEAESAHRQGLELMQALSAEFPNVPDYQCAIGASLNNLGQVLRARGRLTEARALYERAITHQKTALEANPQSLVYRGFLRNHRMNLASTLVRLGDHTRAATETEEFMRISHNPGGDLEFAVQFLASCAKLAEKDSGLSTADRQLRSRRYLERAEVLVKDVVAAAVSAEDLKALNGLAWFLATCPDSRFRDPARAVEVARKAVARAPKANEVWNTLGVAQYRAGGWDEATEALSRSVELSSGGVPADWLFLAMAQWQKRDTDKARSWYDKAVQWMEKNKSQDDELRRFRAEAATLLGLTEHATPTTGKKEEHTTRQSNP